MSTRLKVGNLSDNVTAGELARLFGAYGSVRSAQVVAKIATGRTFGFVLMDTDTDAVRAVTAMHGREISGKEISVGKKSLNPRRSKAPRGFKAGDGRSNGSSGRFGSPHLPTQSADED